MPVSKRLSALAVLVVLLLTGSSGGGERPRTLRSPATIHGFIGGESHDTYVVHAVAGQTLYISISWKLEHDPEIGDNRAEFWVEPQADLNAPGPVQFGQESNGARTGARRSLRPVTISFTSWRTPRHITRSNSETNKGASLSSALIAAWLPLVAKIDLLRLLVSFWFFPVIFFVAFALHCLF
jgi:hypothetical protein